jgi:hypothetical protein
MMNGHTFQQECRFDIFRKAPDTPSSVFTAGETIIKDAFGHPDHLLMRKAISFYTFLIIRNYPHTGGDNHLDRVKPCKLSIIT